MKKSIVMLVCVAATAGCAHSNLVGMRGDSLNTNYSLQDRRLAKQHVKVVFELPPDAEIIGEYNVERCHQYAQEAAPSDAVLMDDLVLLAYAEGADGVTNFRFNRETGLLKNCWTIAKGTATFFRQKTNKNSRGQSTPRNSNTKNNSSI